MNERNTGHHGLGHEVDGPDHRLAAGGSRGPGRGPEATGRSRRRGPPAPSTPRATAEWRLGRHHGRRHRPHQQDRDDDDRDRRPEQPEQHGIHRCRAGDPRDHVVGEPGEEQRTPPPAPGHTAGGPVPTSDQWAARSPSGQPMATTVHAPALRRTGASASGARGAGGRRSPRAAGAADATPMPTTATADPEHRMGIPGPRAHGRWRHGQPPVPSGPRLAAMATTQSPRTGHRPAAGPARHQPARSACARSPSGCPATPTSTRPGARPSSGTSGSCGTRGSRSRLRPIGADDQVGYRVDPDAYYLARPGTRARRAGRPEPGRRRCPPRRAYRQGGAVEAGHGGPVAPPRGAAPAGRPAAGRRPARRCRSLFDAVRKSAVVGLLATGARPRTVDVAGIRFRGGHWYVVGWDRDRGEARTFRVDRIDGLPELGRARIVGPVPTDSTPTRRSPGTRGTSAAGTRPRWTWPSTPPRRPGWSPSSGRRPSSSGPTTARWWSGWS